MSTMKEAVGRGGRRSLTRAVALSALMLSGACGSSYLEEDETDVVVTFRDEGRDYSELRTYLMPTEVVDLCGSAAGGASAMAGSSGEGFDGDCKEADHSLDQTILAELRSNMDALGYREVDDPEEEQPDVAFFVGIVAQDNWFLATAPGYCYDYYFYYWGCWYPSYSYAYNLPTSTIVIDMADVEETDDGEVSSAWTALLQGMHRDTSESEGKRRVESGMKRAFSQSTYLAEGGEE